MKKSGTKNLLLTAALLILPLSLEALPEFTLSAGGGFMIGGLFSNYTITAQENTNKYGPVWMNMTQEMQQFNYGGFVFFDATYAEFSIDIQGGINSYKEGAIATKGPSRADIAEMKGTGSETTLGFTLLVKYPFALTKSLLLYPLAGMTYRVALVEKRTPNGDSTHNRTEGVTEFNRDGNYTLSWWNSWLVNIGAGMDFYFYFPFYLRAEFIYSFRLMTKYEKEAVNWLMDTYDISKPKLFSDPGMRGLTHGPEFRLAVGYRFK